MENFPLCQTRSCAKGIRAEMSWEPRCCREEGSQSAATKESGKRRNKQPSASCPPPLASPPNTPHQPPLVCPNVVGPGGERGKECRHPLRTPCNALSSAAFVTGGHWLLSQQPLHPLLGAGDHSYLSESRKPLAPVSSAGEDSDLFVSLFRDLLSLVLQLSVV